MSTLSLLLLVFVILFICPAFGASLPEPVCLHPVCLLSLSLMSHALFLEAVQLLFVVLFYVLSAISDFHTQNCLACQALVCGLAC